MEANFNLLRVWGGGMVNKAAFHEQCDEKGLMVWQEFPLACNLYEDDPAYLQVLEQESGSIIRRIRKHPSLVIWSGGNELFNSWSGMTDQSLAHPLAQQPVPCTGSPYPFHQHFAPLRYGSRSLCFSRSRFWKGGILGLMKEARKTAYTEFGIPSPSPVELLKSVLPPGELWPPRCRDFLGEPPCL